MVRQRRWISHQPGLFTDFVNGLMLPRPPWALRLLGYRLNLHVAWGGTAITSVNDNSLFQLWLLANPDMEPADLNLASQAARSVTKVIDFVFDGFRVLGQSENAEYLWTGPRDTGWVQTDLKLWGLWFGSEGPDSIHATDLSQINIIVEYEWVKEEIAEYAAIGNNYGLDAIDWQNEPGRSVSNLAAP